MGGYESDRVVELAHSPLHAIIKDSCNIQHILYSPHTMVKNNVLSPILVYIAPNVVQLSNNVIEVSIDLPFETTVSPVFIISLVLSANNISYSCSEKKGMSHYAFNIPLSLVGSYNVTVTYSVQFGSSTIDTSDATRIEGKCI